MVGISPRSRASRGPTVCVSTTPNRTTVDLGQVSQVGVSHRTKDAVSFVRSAVPCRQAEAVDRESTLGCDVMRIVRNRDAGCPQNVSYLLSPHGFSKAGRMEGS